MTHSDIRTYYDERYRSEGRDAFPPDPSRYRMWLRSLHAPPRAGAEVLDYGCGAGHVSTLFVDLGYEVVGVDISAAALAIARQREPRATFIEAAPDGSLPFEADRFDVVAVLGVLEHIPAPETIVRELHRVARPGATGIWVVPNARSPFFWLGHGTGQLEEHPRSLDGWRELLAEAGWTIEEVRRDPGPIDRPIAGWKRLAQGVLNRLPIGLTYQFVFKTRAG